MDLISVIAFLAGLALLIMSSILLASANKLSGDSTEKTNIQRTSKILLGISIAVVLLYGWDLYKNFRSGSSSSAGFSYYF